MSFSQGKRISACGILIGLVLAPIGLPGTPSANAAGHVVSVTKQALTRDGKPFLPRGFNMIGLLAPPKCSDVDPVAAAARSSFGPAELQAARTDWHATVVRFQVSQRGLDPQDPIYDASYLTRISNGVALAENQGLSVILSMQDQRLSCGDVHPLPSAATLRAWANLAPQFATNRNVLLELFNEPAATSTTAGWAQWRNGGTNPVNNLGTPAVGHQALVTRIRRTGATNVLIADGANKAGQLQGMPLLDDPLPADRLAYAVHPYYFHVRNNSTLTQDRANWDERFGFLSGRVPLLATEWNATSSKCKAGTPGRIPDLLDYLQNKSIGLFGHAFDVPSTMVTDLRTWNPTTMQGYGCGVVGPEAGAIVKARFAAQAAP
jgi:hypothetical protein